MLTAEQLETLYGEAIEDDESLCTAHGCRLSYNIFVGYVCPECESEEREAELEECRMENERVWAEQGPYPPDERAGCIFIRGENFTAFQCKMPWWA